MVNIQSSFTTKLLTFFGKTTGGQGGQRHPVALDSV